MTAAEITTIFKLPGEKRLEQFKASAIENACVFGISDDEGWALLGDDADVDIVPLFHHADLAETFRKAAGFDDCAVEQVPLDELLEWLDELDEDGMMVAVCPNTRFEGAIVEPVDLKQELLKKG